MADAHDPGGKSRLPMLPGVVGDAAFSECGRYRYWLSRDWSGEAHAAPFMLWIGMNPSVAEAQVDDPTIRREISFTQREGFSRYVKVNVMDYRATSPATLRKPGVPPCSGENLRIIADMAAHAARIAVCFGSVHRDLRRYADGALRTLRGRELWCLGRNANGSPRHPLYLAADTPMVRYG